MGYRLSKIYTRTGDSGDTGLGDGSRVAKDHLRIDAIGEVDELNCCLGLILAEQTSHEISQYLRNIQNDLFDLGGELSIPGYNNITETQVHRLEQWLDHLNDRLSPLKEFILPAGSRAASLAHLARAICRRAERSLVRLAKNERVSEPARKYLNRLSDLLFVIARALNQESGLNETLWQPGKNKL